MLEFVFARELEDHQLVAANFLGLAEIRIAAGDTAGAVELLRRLVVAVGNPFENLDPAAALLEKTGHNAEAVEFLEQLVQSAPWDSIYRLRLAKANYRRRQGCRLSPECGRIDRGKSGSAVCGENPGGAGSGRCSRPGWTIQLGSDELDLLASGAGTLSATAANQPFFYEARLQAAQGSNEPRIKFQLAGKRLGGYSYIAMMPEYRYFCPQRV